MTETSWFKDLKEDNRDLEEFKLQLNPEELDYAMSISQNGETPGNSFFLNQNFYDVQKLIRQEKGEDKYDELKRKKTDQFQNFIDDKIRREELSMGLHFYQVGNKRDSGQESVVRKKLPPIKAVQSIEQTPNMRVVCYNTSYDFFAIKSGIVKLLTHNEKINLETQRKLNQDDSALHAQSRLRQEDELQIIDFEEKCIQPLS